MERVNGGPLSLLSRAYVYAIHGYFCEILFAAVILDQDWTFPGVTSLWSLLAYGSCGLALERLYLLLREACCLLTRCLLYTLCIYLWQFCTGSILLLFGARPWDFSGFHYNFWGLVALEHSLIWFVTSLLLEKTIICNVLRVRLDPAWKKPPGRPLPRFELKVD
ncbi:transmembrane protein 229B-like [Elgaria multicarinata webbii]|uniref:transmembrane protein 229B-like n=1 Tax=Elgaria multicarinata webbii TaxID=159646 RepID=UPI002FCD1C26